MLQKSQHRSRNVAAGSRLSKTCGTDLAVAPLPSFSAAGKLFFSINKTNSVMDIAAVDRMTLRNLALDYKREFKEALRTPKNRYELVRIAALFVEIRQLLKEKRKKGKYYF